MLTNLAILNSIEICLKEKKVSWFVFLCEKQIMIISPDKNKNKQTKKP